MNRVLLTIVWTSDDVSTLLINGKKADLGGPNGFADLSAAQTVLDLLGVEYECDEVVQECSEDELTTDLLLTLTNGVYDDD